MIAFTKNINVIEDDLTKTLIMKTIKALFLLIITLSIHSCAVYKNPDFSLIRLDMSKEEVINLLGKPQRVVGAQKYDDGLLEIFEYKANKITSEEVDGRYNWLLFLNNKLQEFGDKNQYLPNEYDKYYDKYKRNRR
jgi:hypothetical protein